MKMIKESKLYVCVEDQDNTTLLSCDKQPPEATTTTSTTARDGATNGQRYKRGERAREREREGGEERGMQVLLQGGSVDSTVHNSTYCRQYIVWSRLQCTL